MKKWTVWTEPGSRFPTEMTEVPGRASSQHMIAGPTFEAPDEATANITYKRWYRDGLPHNPHLVPDTPTPINTVKMWRHRGSAHYVTVQGRQMGMTEAQIKNATTDIQIGKLDRVMGEVSRTYHATRTAQAGIFTSFPEATKTIVGYSLKEYERYVETSHVLASATQVAVDEAWRAFGMEPPERSYRVCIGPPPVVEVRSTEDAQKIDAQNVEIAALKARVDDLEGHNYQLEQSLIKAVTPDPACKESEPVLLTEPTPTPAPIQPPPSIDQKLGTAPSQSAPPLHRPHQNPKHPRNAGVK